MKYLLNSQLVFFPALLLLFLSCGGRRALPVEAYYDYDRDLPLKDSVYLLDNENGLLSYYTVFRSVHDRKVTGILSIPEAKVKPLPVVILLHGVGDSKQVDYIEAGLEYLTNAGYAVMRIDISNHGDRKVDDYDFSFTDGYRFWTRDIITQTVFDLRRTIDFLATRPEIDADRIGFYGISLGGFIGTIFSAVDQRVKAPVIALAGGSINLMFGVDALDASTKNYLSIIDPINFVG